MGETALNKMTESLLRALVPSCLLSPGFSLAPCPHVIWFMHEQHSGRGLDVRTLRQRYYVHPLMVPEPDNT